MFKIISSIVIVVFVTVSFILQMLTLFSNFNGLHSLYLARVNIQQGSSNLVANLAANIHAAGGLLGGEPLPDYVTFGIFVICEGTYSGQRTCSPPSFGYNYNTTGVLQTLQEKIPENMRSLIAKLQQGVFIPSVILCFLLLCYTILSSCFCKGLCNSVLILLLAIIALLFCVATFVIQYLVFNRLAAEIDQVKNNLFGGLLNSFLTIWTTRGRTIWLNLSAFILLFLVCVLLLLDCCFGVRRRRKQRAPYAEQYD